MKRQLLSLLGIALCTLFLMTACGDDGGTTSSSQGNTDVSGNGDDDENVVQENFLPQLVGKWYIFNESTEYAELELVTINSDMTWDRTVYSRSDKDSFILTTTESNEHGTFTLDSQNMLLTTSKGESINVNFSRDGLREDVLRVVIRKDGKVDNAEYNRFKYASADDFLNEWAEGHESGNTINYEALKHDIVGTWRVYSTMEYIMTNGMQGQITADMPDDRIVITEDGTLTYMEKNASGDYKEAGTGKFTIRENVLDFTEGAFSYVFVRQASDTTLDIKIGWKDHWANYQITQRITEAICYRVD